MMVGISEVSPGMQKVEFPDYSIPNPGSNPRLQNVADINKGRNQNSENKSKAPVPLEKMETYTDQLNQVLAAFNRDLRFSVDKETEKTVIKIVDSKTGEVIRQIPPEVMLKLMHHIDRTLGLILDETV